MLFGEGNAPPRYGCGQKPWYGSFRAAVRVIQTLDQSADPSPMDQTDKSLDPSPQHEHICMVALHPTTFSPIHCEGGGFPDQSHPVCGKLVLKFWPL